MFSRKLLGTLTVIAATAAVPWSAAARGPGPEPVRDAAGIRAAAAPFSAAVAPVAAFALQEATQMESRRYARADARTLGRRVQYRGRVRVGADGNGVTAATFPTTLAGDDVRYVLVLQNGCPATSPTVPCPIGVDDLQVTLNGEVVLDGTAPETARHDIALNAIRTDDNQITVTAAGNPRAAADIRILALRTPQRVQFRGEVTVGADGNGAGAATFATTLAGDDVRYELVVDADCNPTGPCRPAVSELDVFLNEEPVLHTTDLDNESRRQIALNPPDTDRNRILITARGFPGAGARIQVFAVRTTGADGCGSLDPGDGADRHEAGAQGTLSVTM